MKKTFLIPPCIIIFALLGCASSQKTSQNALNQSALMWMSQSPVIEVEEAYSSDEGILIKYNAFLRDNSQAKEFYCKANWKEFDKKQIDLSTNLSLPLVYTDRSTWVLETARREAIAVLGSSHWKIFREELLKHLLPANIAKGVVLTVDENELFVYKEGEDMKMCALKDKPADVEIDRTITSEEFAKITLDQLASYSRENHIQATKVLLTIAEDEIEDNPFLFIDMEKGISISLRIEPPGRRYKGNQVNKSVKTVDHLILKSHVTGLVTRPFSSAFKLLYWGKSAVMDVLRPKRISFLIPGKIPPLYEGKGMDLGAWEKELDQMVGNNRTQGDIQFLIGGDEFFPRLIDAILGAKEKIDMRTFIFDNDDYALKIANLLKKRSKEGVKVKVLLDGMGTIMGEEAYPADLPPGYVPPQSIISYLPKKSKVKVRVKPNAWLKADHTKTTVIDDEIGFTGGMNIGREYRYNWHDLMMEVRGPIIAEINKEFDLAWEHASKLGDLALMKELIGGNGHKSVTADKNYPEIRPLYTRFNDQQIFRTQLAAIRKAKKYIYINNAYFSDNAILDELINARRRGVDVRVILPVHGNHEIMNASNIVTANVMFKNGIRVFFYPGMSHIKAAIYDGWFCAGSANFDKLSFRDNLEFNLATSDEGIVGKALSQLFTPDFQKSKEMKELIRTKLTDYLSEFLAEQL